MNDSIEQEDGSLIGQAGVAASLQLTSASESAWIEVIHKMDSVYADLVHYQVELEQKNAALEEAQQFISSVLSAMTDVLIVCDTGGRVEQINTALEDLTGKQEEAFLQQPLGNVFGADSMAMVEQFPQKLGSHSLIDCEVSVLCADGSTTPLAMNCSSRYDHEGRLVGMVLIGRPMGELRRAYEGLNQAHDELKQAQWRLVQSEKMASLGRLVAGVAHELNNPISFVFGNMHALKRYSSRVIEYLGEVHAHTDSVHLQQRRKDLKIDRILEDVGSLIDGTLEGAERVSHIVQDLRQYSGGQKEESSRFDLPLVIKKAAEWVSRASRVKPEVHYKLPERLEIESCKGQIHQILVNLMQNAVDAMERLDRPRLMLACDTSGDFINIHVIDEGPGIPEQDLGHLFDPFFTTKPVGQGTGLGLYIGYALAHDLGGSLTAANQPQGGAIFTLSLPSGNADIVEISEIDPSAVADDVN